MKKYIMCFLLIQISFSQINPGEVIWEENFDNLDNWIIETGNGSWGWGNGELQYYKPENVEIHGRLEPGKMFLVNMDEGRIIEDDEIKKTITSKMPYGEWLEENLLSLKDIPYINESEKSEKEDFETRMRVFGYTQEDLKSLVLLLGEFFGLRLRVKKDDLRSY